MSGRAPEDPCALAMSALEDELVIPHELEARLVAAAYADRARDAMAALDDELELPRDLEARLLASLPADARPAPPRRARFAVALVGACALGAGYLALVRGHAPDPAADASSSSVDRPIITAELADRAADRARAIDWRDGSNVEPKLAALEALRAAVVGVGDRQSAARVAPIYVDGVRRAFLDGCMRSLEASLVDSHAPPNERRQALKQYILLGEGQKAMGSDGPWLTQTLPVTCARTIGAAWGRPEADVAATLKPHVVALVWALQTEIARRPEVDWTLVARARTELGDAPHDGE